MAEIGRKELQPIAERKNKKEQDHKLAKICIVR